MQLEKGSENIRETERISFIVPVYNAEDCLEACVSSIQMQQVDLEIILVNDGSTDHTGAICDHLAQKDCRVKVIHQQNAGVSAARNVGMDACSGRYIWFVDADDVMEPGAAEKMLNQTQCTCADIIVCGIIVDNLDSRSVVPIHIGASGLYLGRPGQAEILPLLEERKLFALCANKLFDAAFLRKNGVRFPATNGPVEDILFMMNIFPKAHSIVLLDEVLYRYVQRNQQSMSRRYFQDLFEIGSYINELRRDLYKILGITSVQQLDCCACACFFQDFHSVKNLYRLPRSNMRDTRQRVWRQIFESQQIREEVERASLRVPEAKLMRFALNLPSPAFADCFFAFLMWMRNRMRGLYARLRDRIFLSERE